MRYLVIVLACAGVAHAQPSTDASASADILFDEAKALMDRGELARACQKFEASLKLDGTAIGTRVNLADCYERVGRLASAWSMYRSAADRARISHDPRAPLATERASKLEPRLPKLTILATGGPPSLTVTRAGVPVEAALFGTQVFVDPGKTVVTASAPGFQSYEVTVELAEGATQQIEVPPLVPIPEHRTPVQPAPSRGTQERTRDPKRVWTGVAIAGGGALLAGTGIVLGVTASSAWDEAFSSGGCDRETKRCNARGQALTDRARTQATLSTVLVGGGIVAAGVGAYLVIAAPKRPSTATAVVPVVSDGGVGIVMARRF